MKILETQYECIVINKIFKPGRRPARAWFLRIALSVCVCVCVWMCVCVCVRPRGYE